MARIRSIHPGLFTDEAFMEASPMARILMIGLWGQCWDDGVFEWKPVVLKARLFPADSVDANALLAELVSLNVIKEFTAGGKRYGVVRNFQRYQRPKKPNSSGLLTSELAKYAGNSDASDAAISVAGNPISEPEPAISDPEDEEFPTSSEPVPHRFPTSSEIAKQMEDGGWRMEEIAASQQPRAPAPVGASDDWPPDPKEWAQTICREADSPNLDIHQSQDLLLGMRHLVGMRAAGCSWTLDVIPVVTDLAGRSKRRIGSWEYFREAILEARNRRIEAGKAMPAPPKPMDDQAREQVIERALRMRTLSPSTPWPATIGMDEEAAKRWLETVRAA